MHYWESNANTRVDGRAGNVDGNYEEGWCRDLVSKEQGGARGYSAQQHDGLYSVAVFELLPELVGRSIHRDHCTALLKTGNLLK